MAERDERAQREMKDEALQRGARTAFNAMAAFPPGQLPATDEAARRFIRDGGTGEGNRDDQKMDSLIVQEETEP